MDLQYVYQCKLAAVYAILSSYYLKTSITNQLGNYFSRGQNYEQVPYSTNIAAAPLSPQRNLVSMLPSVIEVIVFPNMLPVAGLRCDN